MWDLAIACILSAIVLIAGTISIELGIASAIIETLLGVLAGSTLHIAPTRCGPARLNALLRR